MIPASTSHKTARGRLLAAFLAILLVSACASDRGGGPGGPDSGYQPGDWGEAVASEAGGGPGTTSSGPESVWTIVLATFSQPGHAQAATRSRQQLGRIDPTLGGDAWVHTGPDGSVVAYGRYESPGTADAQRDLAWVKGLTLDDVPAFPRAMLSRIKLRAGAAQYDALNLMSARLRYPTVDPLYTLEVAVWGDFESGELSLEEIQRAAENYTRQLRARGFEAYYHHDNDRRLSMVTVGLFDYSAIDQRTGLYGPAVDALAKQFPAHLVNGEELLEPIDGRRPQRGTRVQRPVLVLVPKL
jgi:hypothetical protein